MDEIPDGNDHSIVVVRYDMIDDILQGWATAFLAIILAIVAIVGIFVCFQMMRLLACALMILVLLAFFGI